jgi:hypothetical protein
MPKLIHDRPMHEPAYSIIRRLGGATVVAEALGLSPGAVSRWYMPRPRGLGGVVPSKHIKTLCEMAEKSNILLEPNMFFQPPVDSTMGGYVW